MGKEREFLLQTVR